MEQGESRRRNQVGQDGDLRTKDDAAAGPAGVPSSLALAFLTGKSELTDVALVGLNQTLLMPTLVSRVVSASKAGAKLAANVDTRGSSRRSWPRITLTSCRWPSSAGSNPITSISS